MGRGLAINDGEDGVDAIGGDDGVDGVEVGGRDADSRPSAGPVGDDPSNPVGVPEQQGGLGGLSLGEGLANSRRGDDPAVELGGRGDLELEAGLGAPGTEELGVSPSVPAEAEGRPFDHPPGPQLAQDHAVEELAGGQAEEPGAGPEDADLGRPGGLHQFDSPLHPGQGRGGGVGSEDGDRGRVEGQGDRGRPGGVGLRPESGQEVCVASVDAVEVADRHERA